MNRYERVKALGNGVVPQQSEAAVRFLLPLLRQMAANGPTMGE